MATVEKMTEDALLKQIRASISDAISFDDTELSARRAKAIEYYNGEIKDVPPQEGRSKVTAHTLAEVMGWLLPGLMRVFLAGETIGEFEPEGPEDEEGAKQATDYINFVFLRECEGYKVLQNGIFEGLLYGNGVLKVWWDASPKYSTYDYTGLSDDDLTALTEADNVDVLQHDERTEVIPVPDPETGEPISQEVPVHDVKIRRVDTSGRIRIQSLPPEEFLLEKNATTMNEAGFLCHRYEATREALIKQGYPKGKVLEINTGTDNEYSDEKQSRFDDTDYSPDDERSDTMMQKVEVYESYIQADMDNDGHSEWRKVVTGGRGEKASLLSNEEYDDDLPFVDLVPMPRPHRRDGRSIFDETEDLARVNTALLRQTLDNLYLTNNPERSVWEQKVTNPESLESREVGKTILTKQPPGQVIQYDVVPFAAGQSFPMLEYLEMVGEKRTGVSRQSTGLDPDALQDQTATQFNGMQSASYAKQELYARNLAEGGIRDLFRKMLRLFHKHQDKPKTIRLRNDWIPMDPSVWNADMDCTVTVGLGSGSRERDLQTLMAVKQAQEAVMGQMGPNNPLVGLHQYSNTLTRMVEAAGLKSPDSYFSDLSPEDAQQFMAQQSEQPSPEMQEMQAKMELEGQKAQSDAQLAQMKLAQEAQADQANFALKREQLQAEMALKREQLVAEMQMRREQFAMELQLKREMGFVDASVKSSVTTSPVRMGGAPG